MIPMEKGHVANADAIIDDSDRRRPTAIDDIDGKGHATISDSNGRGPATNTDVTINDNDRRGHPNRRWQQVNVWLPYHVIKFSSFAFTNGGIPIAI